EAAGGEDDRGPARQRAQGLVERDAARSLDQRLGQPGRVEADAGRERVAGLAPGQGRPERLEPVEVRVEPLEDESLKRGVAVGAVRAEGVELAVPPDDPAREQHRAAGAVALLEYAHVRPARACLRGRREPGHAGPGDDQVRPPAQTSEKLGLCSTYSSLIRSGP